MSRPRLFAFPLAVVLAGTLLPTSVSSQTPPTRRPPVALLLLSLAAETPGLALINALTDAQRAQAVLSVSKTANDNLIEAW